MKIVKRISILVIGILILSILVAGCSRLSGATSNTVSIDEAQRSAEDGKRSPVEIY